MALALATIVVYFRTFHYDFVMYDDDAFVYHNPVVKAGITPQGLAWAFGLHFANWHPLTWFSYLLDAQLFGMNAGGFHLVNVLLHAASAVLLFLALFWMTGHPWRCLVVAAVFALHPLHVESVAWVAERKDVLSTFLEMVALLLYLRYAEKETTKRYLLMFVAFACSLMAKPMLVTFPFILLLLDYWPLRRLRWPPRWPRDRRIAVEKVPLLLISLVVSALTMVAQKNYGAVTSFSAMPLANRILNAATAYVTYIKQALWPVKLGVLYPTADPAPSTAQFSLLALLIVTAVALARVRKMPYFFTGWFWYVVMLVPVIGLVQVGAQSRADRYTYVPLVGLTVAIVWATGDWLERHQAFKRTFVVATAAVLLAFTAVTWRQVAYWKDSRTLFEHTIAVTERNYIMKNNLGVILAQSGDNWHAMIEYMAAMDINPNYAEAKGNMGNTLLRIGNIMGARPLLQEAIRLKTDFPMAQLDMGIVEARRGSYESALRHLNEALRQAPEDPEVHSNLCYVLEHMGRLDEAIARCREALRLRPNYPDAEYNLRNSLAERH
jgi:tetratricopeptide (TPR) repeat protein